MKTNQKSKLPYLLSGVGAAAVAALMFALRAREDTRKHLRERGRMALDTLNQQGRKLRESATRIVRKRSPKDTTATRGESREAERQDYEQQKRDNLGG